MIVTLNTLRTCHDLCHECFHICEYDTSWKSSHVLLCTEASSLLQMGRDPAWRELADTILALTSAALNTPVPEYDSSRGTWCILIHMRNYNEEIDYIGSFAEKLDDKLYGLLPRKAEFSEIFDKSIIAYRGLHFLQLQIQSTTSGIAIKDGRTALIADRGLMDGAKSDLDTICYHLCEKPTREKPDLPPRPQMLDNCLVGGAVYLLRETASLQLKRLRHGDFQNVVSRKETREVFSPESGMDYVKWIWQDSRRSIGEYISAFAKLPTGGIYYCGMKEERRKMASHEFVTNYSVEGLRLSANWRAEMKNGLEKKIREDMLWLERDEGADKWFKDMMPEESRHFSIEFLPVQSRDTSPIAYWSPPRQKNQKSSHLGQQHPSHQWGPSSSWYPTSPNGDSLSPSIQSYEGEGNASKRTKTTSPTDFEELYILEVRVAPFSGIVFHHREGPEVYTMEKSADSNYRPVPMPRKRWEEELANHGRSRRKTSSKGLCTECPLHCGHSQSLHGGSSKVVESMF